MKNRANVSFVSGQCEIKIALEIERVAARANDRHVGVHPPPIAADRAADLSIIDVITRIENHAQNAHR